MTETTGGYVITGGSGNIAPFVAQTLLRQGANVAVPTRSPTRADALRRHLEDQGTNTSRLHTVVGDLSDQRDALRVREETLTRIGTPVGVLAALGNFVTTDNILRAPRADLDRVLDSYVVAHFMAARSFLPSLQASGGTYLMLQGPVAFRPAPAYGTDLISIATAAQDMLFRTLAEDSDATPARVLQLVGYALIRDRQTQPGSPYSGADLGRHVARLLSGDGAETNGATIHLRSADQIADLAASG